MAGVAVVLLFVVGVILLVGAAVVGVCVFFAVRNRKKVAAIEGTEVCPVGELDEGYRKVNGRVVALERPIASPLSRTPCVFYQFRVQELRTRQVYTGGTGPNGTGGSYRTETYW